MKVSIEEEEWYPVYMIRDKLDGYMHRNLDFEIPSDLWARYKIALQAWNAVQDEVEAVYKKELQT